MPRRHSWRPSKGSPYRAHSAGPNQPQNKSNCVVLPSARTCPEWPLCSARNVNVEHWKDGMNRSEVKNGQEIGAERECPIQFQSHLLAKLANIKTAMAWCRWLSSCCCRFCAQLFGCKPGKFQMLKDFAIGNNIDSHSDLRKCQLTAEHS